MANALKIDTRLRSIIKRIASKWKPTLDGISGKTPAYQQGDRRVKHMSDRLPQQLGVQEGSEVWITDD